MFIPTGGHPTDPGRHNKARKRTDDVYVISATLEVLMVAPDA